MKTFDELTKEEQVKACKFAEKLVKEYLVEQKETLPISEVRFWALQIAEFGDYNDDGSPITDPNAYVPSLYLGGCV